MAAITATPETEPAKQRMERELEDHARFSDLLHELCPDGLTDDCPARKAKATA